MNPAACGSTQSAWEHQWCLQTARHPRCWLLSHIAHLLLLDEALVLRRQVLLALLHLQLGRRLLRRHLRLLLPDLVLRDVNQTSLRSSSFAREQRHKVFSPPPNTMLFPAVRKPTTGHQNLILNIFNRKNWRRKLTQASTSANAQLLTEVTNFHSTCSLTCTYLELTDAGQTGNGHCWGGSRGHHGRRRGGRHDGRGLRPRGPGQHGRRGLPRRPPEPRHRSRRLLLLLQLGRLRLNSLLHDCLLLSQLLLLLVDNCNFRVNHVLQISIAFDDLPTFLFTNDGTQNLLEIHNCSLTGLFRGHLVLVVVEVLPAEQEREARIVLLLLLRHVLKLGPVPRHEVGQFVDDVFEIWIWNKRQSCEEGVQKQERIALNSCPSMCVRRIHEAQDRGTRTHKGDGWICLAHCPDVSARGSKGSIVCVCVCGGGGRTTRRRCTVGKK